jgi:hypothetical protein
MKVLVKFDFSKGKVEIVQVKERIRKCIIGNLRVFLLQNKTPAKRM